MLSTLDSHDVISPGDYPRILFYDGLGVFWLKIIFGKSLIFWENSYSHPNTWWLLAYIYFYVLWTLKLWCAVEHSFLLFGIWFYSLYDIGDY